MGAFSKRYFVWISLILLGFAYFSFTLRKIEFFIIFALFLAICTFFLSIKRKLGKNYRTVLLLFVIAAVFSSLNSGREMLGASLTAEKYSGDHTVEGYVKEMPSKESYRSEHLVHIESVDGERADFDCVLITEYQSELIRGDFFSVKAKLSPLAEYGELEYLKNKNSYKYPVIAIADEYSDIEYLDDEFRMELMLSGLNSKLSGLLLHHIGGESGELASALLLGNRSLLRDEVLRDFRLAGVYHMLALSGQHVAILVGLSELLLRRLGADRRIRALLLGAATLFYIALTGFMLSACRAMLMLWTVYLSFLFGKRSDSLTSLFIAGSAIVIISPSAVLDIGFQLSFLSTFGVIAAMMIKDRVFFLRAKSDKESLKARFAALGRKLLTLLLISLCVLVVTLPVIAESFGELSLATFISNLFMGGVCEVFMVLALITLSLTGAPEICAFFGDISELVGEFMMQVIGGIADIDGILISLNYPFTQLLVGALFAVCILFFAVQIKRWWLLALTPLCFALMFCINVLAYGMYRDDFVRVEYLYGDCIVLSNSDGVYICDASNGRTGALSGGIAVAKENCHTQIDGIVLTHYHSYHIRTLEKISNNHKLKRIFLPYPQNDNELSVLSSVYRALEDEGTEIIIYEANSALPLLGGELTVSERAYYGNYAHPSIGLTYSYKDGRVTLIERPYFGTYLEEKGDLLPFIAESDVLIFGGDGRTPEAEFSVFEQIPVSAEVWFSDYELLEMSDFEAYMDTHEIYFSVEYKKYDLK